MRRMYFFLLTTIVCSLPVFAATRFAHTDGAKIVNAHGKELHLRGTNLGNWMVPEGYMWHLGENAQSAREIETLIEQLTGPEKAAAFWRRYRDDYVRKEDIDLLHAMGFDSIRIPFHYKFFESDDAEGFRLTDRVVQWAKADGMYVILDMHAAPGGQTGKNIDDSLGYPWLYDSPAERKHTAAIWQRIAKHYRNDPTVLAYDLLNEPIPPYPRLRKYNDQLEGVYRELVAAVRTVDPNHMVMLGGAQWDGNFSVFGKPFDPNTIYTWHKYKTKPTDETVLKQYLDFREKWNVPIWLGESGENTDEWVRGFRTMVEAHNIGWAFWPYKKMNNGAGVVQFPQPEGWDKIVAWAELNRNSGNAEKTLEARPEQAEIDKTLELFLQGIRIEKCVVNSGYVRALGLEPKEAPKP